MHLNLAHAYLKLNNNSAVVFHCQKVLEIDPRNCKALFRMSLAYSNNCEYQKAEQVLLKALALEPHNTELAGLWRKICEEKRRFLKQAREVSKRAFSIPKPLRAASWGPTDPGLEDAEEPRGGRVGVFEAVYLVVAIVFMVAKGAMSLAVHALGAIAGFAMSFWFIRIPVNIWVVIPWRIARNVLRWLLGRMEAAADRRE